jgi:hypothetical protein
MTILYVSRYRVIPLNEINLTDQNTACYIPPDDKNRCDNRTALNPNTNRLNWLPWFRKQPWTTWKGQSLTAVLCYMTAWGEVRWWERPMNLTDKHECKVMCRVLRCTSMPHSPTNITMNGTQTKMTVHFYDTPDTYLPLVCWTGTASYHWLMFSALTAVSVFHPPCTHW